MSEDLVSVVIPTYNREKTLMKSIQSVLQQSYQNIELIIVDDCSTDKTRQLVKGVKDNRVRYVRNDKNFGPSYSRNSGIQASRGNYIAFQDSDDVWENEKLMLQMNLMKSDSQLSVVYCGYTKHIDDGTTQFIPSKSYAPLEKEGFIYESLLKANKIGTPTILCKRICLDKVGMFDVLMKAYEDWDLSLRLAKEYKIGFVDQSLVNVTSSLNSVNSNSDNIIDGLCRMLEKYKEDYVRFSLVNQRVCEILEHAIQNATEKTEDIREFLVPEYISSNMDFDLLIHETRKTSKFRQYYELLIKMLEKDDLSRHLENICDKNNWKTVAVYGIGEIGKILITHLIKSNIVIKYGIDRNPNAGNNQIKIIHPGEITDDIDAVIITAVSDFDKIENEIRKYSNCDIVPIQQIL